MGLDEIHRPGVAEELQRAADVDPHQRQALAEYGLVEGEIVALVELADAEFLVAEHGGLREALVVAGGEQGALARRTGLGDAAEEELHVALQAIRQFPVGLAAPEVTEREVDQEVFLATDGGRLQFLGAEEASDPLVDAAPGTDQANQRLRLGTFVGHRRATEFESLQPVCVDLLPVRVDQRRDAASLTSRRSSRHSRRTCWRASRNNCSSMGSRNTRQMPGATGCAFAPRVDST